MASPYTVWLRDTYARLLPWPTSRYWVGTTAYLYLHRHPDSQYCSASLQLVVPQLRNVYDRHTRELTADQQDSLQQLLKEDMITWNESEVEEGYTTFEPVGEITEFDQVLIPVTQFLQALNARRPLTILLLPTLALELHTAEYDFWSAEQQQLIKSSALVCS